MYRRHSVIQEMVDDDVEDLDKNNDNSKYVKVFLKSVKGIKSSSSSISYFDAKKGMPMNTFRKDACVKIRKDILSQSKYFRERMKKYEDDDEGGEGLIVVELKSIKLLDSYLVALNALSSSDSPPKSSSPENNNKKKVIIQQEPRIDRDNMLDILVAAHTFNMPQLVMRCTEYVSYNLSPQLLCSAMKVAMDTNCIALLRVIHNWVKSCSPLSISTSNQEKVTSSGKNRRKSRFSITREKDVVAKDELFFSLETLSIVYENNHLALPLFDSVVRFFFFFFTSKNDAIPMGTPEGEKRDGFMGMFEARFRFTFLTLCNNIQFIHRYNTI